MLYQMAALLFCHVVHYQGFRFCSGESVNIDGREAKVEICKLWSWNNPYFFENSER